MFKINIYLKFALIAIGIIGGIALWSLYGIWYGFPFLLAGIILLASYFLLGTIMSTAEMIQEGRFDEAEKNLGLTKFPKLLYVTNRALYYTLNGALAMNKKDTNKAEEYFNEALALDLPTGNEKAMVLVQMANINAMRSNWPAAKKFVKQADELKVTEPQIKGQIDQLKQAINQRGSSMNAMGMGRKGREMMKRGGMSGKRRRPKMR